MNMIRDEHCHMLSDGPGLRASVASPGRYSVIIILMIIISRELRAAAHLPLHSSQVRPVVDERVDDLDVPSSRPGQGQVEAPQALFIVHSGLHTHDVPESILLRPVTCLACPGMFCFKPGSMLELTSKLTH